MKERLNNLYGLEPTLIEKSSVGTGSDTYFVTCADGKCVVKFPALSEINHPEAEPELCEYLNCQGVPCCHFLRNNIGNFLSTDANGRLFHVQKFIEGRLYGLNEAPDWLLIQSAQMLGKIHTILRNYSGLPVGIGADFFQCMIPLFYYQIAVCDYYGQYYASTAASRHISPSGYIFYKITPMVRKGFRCSEAFGFIPVHFTATDKHFTAIKLFWRFRQAIIKCLSNGSSKSISFAAGDIMSASESTCLHD